MSEENTPILKQNKQAFEHSLKHAKTRFQWLNFALDPLITDDQSIVETFVRITRAHPKLTCQIIVADDHLLHFKRHRLIYVMQRLSSAFDIRRYYHPNNQPPTATFALCDQYAYYRPMATQWSFELIHEPARLRQFEEMFIEYWHLAEPFNPFRRLDL